MRSFDSSSRPARLARRASGAATVVTALGVFGAGCLSRPVQPGEPALKTNFTAPIQQQTVDKIDMLFMIDNSASMGDKQVILGEAVPQLVTRLVTPNCIAADGTTVVGITADGTCTDSVGGQTAAKGSKAEFPPVHDMHIGIVSSSLGGRGSDQCNTNPNATPASVAAEAKNPAYPTLSSHNNDNGYLINRAPSPSVVQGFTPSDSVEDQLGNAIQGAAATSTDPNNASDPSNGDYWLGWYPTSGANAGKNQGHTPPPKFSETDATQLGVDFTALVSGVHEYGCGFEAQLESWYRFLIQPDPYQYITPADLSASPPVIATLKGIDGNILQERADFLRPDSLVAIIDLTDENDSTVDPLVIGGQGSAYEETAFPGSTTGGGAAGGTAICATNPNDPTCTSCGFCNRSTNPPTPASICNDPACATGPAFGFLSTTQDGLNERFFHMKQRFGVDPQFPISRYINGLTSKTVPNQVGEHGSGPVPSTNYLSNNNCVNPLFATALPTSPTAELCKLTPGPRSPDLVYFAAITGISWQLLLQGNPQPPYNGAASSGAAFKQTLTDDEWTAIIGKDPLNYDFSGADPHMLESETPRGSLPASGTGGGPGTTDPIVGWDYDTALDDLEYACTFPFATPKNCLLPQYSNACDCSTATTGAANKPLCAANPADPTGGNTLQVKGKAYPSIRELSVVRQLGKQGIVSSLCPATDASGALLPTSDPNSGYQPAVAAIINRLKASLASQCLPQQLTPNSTGTCSNGGATCAADSDCSGGSCSFGYPCLVLVTLSDQAAGAPESVCNSAGTGFSIPDPDILAKYQAQQHTDFVNKVVTTDYSVYPTCELAQIVESAGSTCATGSTAGWCYVVNTSTATPAGVCGQSILFTSSGNPSGAQISIQCIEASSVTTGAAADGG